MQKDVYELLGKGAIEPLSDEAVFHSNIFVVPNVWVESIYACTYFKMPTIRQVWLLLQQGDYAFSIDVKDSYLHIPIVKYHCHFFFVCLATQTISVEGFVIWAGHSP